MKERAIKFVLAFVALTIPLVFLVIVIHVLYEARPAIQQIGGGLFDVSGSWRPLSREASYSILPMILGTLYVSVLAVALAAPVGCTCALFLNYFAEEKFSKLMLSFIELLAGIPSVIFGFLGLLIIVKFFENSFKMPTGECVLAAAILLSIMLLPFIISNYSESIGRAKKKYNDISLALGVSREYCICNIIIPATKKSIAVSVMAAFGRAMGETMAVMMVMGNSPIFPRLFGRGTTIPSLTALEVGSVEYGSLHLSAIYSANLVLLIILGIILTITYFLKRELVEEHDEL